MFDAFGVGVVFAAAAVHPLAGFISAAAYAATGGAIGTGITATLLDMNPSEVQAEALLGALTDAFGSIAEPRR